VKDLDSLAAREILVGSLPCHILCRRRDGRSSSSSSLEGTSGFGERSCDDMRAMGDDRFPRLHGDFSDRHSTALTLR
jgi:hypothetical protein